MVVLNFHDNIKYILYYKYIIIYYKYIINVYHINISTVNVILYSDYIYVS